MAMPRFQNSLQSIGSVRIDGNNIFYEEDSAVLKNPKDSREKAQPRYGVGLEPTEITDTAPGLWMIFDRFVILPMEFWQTALVATHRFCQVYDNTE